MTHKRFGRQHILRGRLACLPEGICTKTELPQILLHTEGKGFFLSRLLKDPVHTGVALTERLKKDGKYIGDLEVRVRNFPVLGVSTIVVYPA